MAYNLDMDLYEPSGIPEIVETTADTCTQLIEYLIIEEYEAQDDEEYDCDKCHMCEPGDRYCIRR